MSFGRPGGPGGPPPGFHEEKKKREIEEKVLWRWMLHYLKPMKSQILVLTILLFIFTIIETYIPRFQETLIDNGIIKGDWTFTLQIMVLWLGLFLVSAIGNTFVNYYFGKMGQEIIFNMRNDLFEHLQKISLAYYDTHHSGDIISTATNDIDQINVIMGGQLIQVLMDVFKGIFIIVLMFVINVELALISMVLIPIFFIASQIFKMKVKSAFRETRKQMSNVTQKAQENISGMKVIKSYGKEEKAAAEFDDANKQNTAAMLKVRKIFAFYFPIIMFVTSIFSTLILLYAGIAIQDGISMFGSVITIGTFMVFNTYLSQFFQPLFAITMFQQFVESALASAERIYLLLSEDTELIDPANPAKFDKVEGEIEYKHVQFSYPKRKVKTEGKSMAELYTATFGADQKTGAGKQKSGFKQKMIEKMMEKKSSMAKMFGMNGLKAAQSQDPQMLLKLANTLDSQLRGSVKLGAVGGGEGAGGMGGNGGGPGGQGMMNKEMIMTILSDPKIPKDIKEQFSPIVKQTIEEFIKMKARNAASGDVFKDLNFTIDQGKTIGIVGETGAGKTTLVKLIPRFYEIQSGEVLVDGINTKEVSKQQLRSKIGMVPQDSFLFSDTIENNLLYGIDATSTEPKEMETYKAKMVEIAQFLGLDNFIQRMPHKYDTKLLENASNISIGQRQLIAFARVLLLDPKILILDEATSSVDPYTETLIQDALDKVRKGRTTLIIAHRLSTIKNADEIFVLSNGELIERGTHTELMQKNGKYAQLVKNQASE